VWVEQMMKRKWKGDLCIMILGTGIFTIRVCLSFGRQLPT
jgi:hypothetical protein